MQSYADMSSHKLPEIYKWSEKQLNSLIKVFVSWFR